MFVDPDNLFGAPEEGENSATKLKRLKKYSQVGWSRWLKVAMMILSATTFKDSFGNTPLTSLNPDIVRMAMEFLPMEKVENFGHSWADDNDVYWYQDVTTLMN